MQVARHTLQGLQIPEHGAEVAADGQFRAVPVDRLAASLEAPLNIPSSLRRTMSAKESVRKENSMTIYLNAGGRPGFAPFVR